MQPAYNEARSPIEEHVLERLRDLPPEKQKEVLDFVAALKQKNGSETPRRSLLGLWADLNVHITEEDIAEAGREMWGKFPRTSTYERGARYAHCSMVSRKLQRIVCASPHNDEDAIRNACDVHVSAISVIETVYLVERRKLPAVGLHRLRSALVDPHAGLFIAPVDASVADALEKIPRSVVPDMPDRIIAATPCTWAFRLSGAIVASNPPELRQSGSGCRVDMVDPRT